MCTDCHVTIYRGISSPLIIFSTVTNAMWCLDIVYFSDAVKTKLFNCICATGFEVLENWFLPLDKCPSFLKTKKTKKRRKRLFCVKISLTYRSIIVAYLTIHDSLQGYVLYNEFRQFAD